MRHASAEAIRTSTPASTSSRSKKRCRSSVADAARSPSSVRSASRPDIRTRPAAARFESAFVTLGFERARRSAMSTLRHDQRRRRITRMASR